MKAPLLLRKALGVLLCLAAASPSPRVFAQADIDTVPEFEAAVREADFAVIIGVEKYRDLPPSDYSAGDAKLVSGYLLALGWPARNIELLIDERATRSDIAKAIERWLPNNIKPDSKVLVYFSGHGSPEPSTGEAFLMPYDGDANYLTDTAYPLPRLYEQLGKLPVKEVVVVMDSCFSGAGPRSVMAKGVRPLVASMMKQPVPTANLAVLAATKVSQTSTSSEAKKHGVFTYHFLKAIRDGKTALTDIYRQVKPAVENEAKSLNVEQSPVLNPAPEQVEGRYVFFKHVPLPPDARKDVEMGARLEAERKKFEQEQSRLDEERRQMIEKMEQDKRSMEEQRRRMEQDMREKEARMDQERRELERKKKKSAPAFVPPTF